MKKKLALLLVACALLATLCSTLCSCNSMTSPASSTKQLDFTDANGVGYSILPDGTLEVIQVGESKKIKIPREYNGRTVTSIGKSSFRMSKVEEVILPNTIKSIAEYSFSFATELKEIIIPEGITEISANTFTGCTSLTYVQLPESLEKIGMYAFDGSGIECAVIPMNVTTIDEFAFAECPYLTDVIFHGNQVEISDTAFGKSSEVIIYAEKNSKPMLFAKNKGIENVVVQAD